MHEIRMRYFFLSVVLQVESNPGEELVVIHQKTILGTFEFLRVPVQVAYELAGFLETGAHNATAAPVVAGQIGEINGIAVRAMGTLEMRIQISVNRSGAIRFGIRQKTTRVGRKIGHHRPKLSVDEAQRFAKALRDANVTPAIEAELGTQG